MSSRSTHHQARRLISACPTGLSDRPTSKRTWLRCSRRRHGQPVGSLYAEEGGEGGQEEALTSGEAYGVVPDGGVTGHLVSFLIERKRPRRWRELASQNQRHGRS